MAIPRPRMHLGYVYAQPRIPVYLSRAKDISGFLAYREPNHQFNKNKKNNKKNNKNKNTNNENNKKNNKKNTKEMKE
jgi:hypothetical protein